MIPAPQWTPGGIEPGPTLDAFNRAFQMLASLQSQVSSLPSSSSPSAASSQQHNVSYAISGKPTNGQVTLAYTYTSTVSYPVNFGGSQGAAGALATANARFTIAKNGVTVGYFTATPANGFSFTSTGPQTFKPGDTMTITAPATADATLANIHVNFAGTIG